MGFLERVLTPRGRRQDTGDKPQLPALPTLSFPTTSGDASEFAQGRETPRASKLGKVVSAAGKVGRLLTPRRRQTSGSVTPPYLSPRFASPGVVPGLSDAQRTRAYLPASAGLLEQHLDLSDSPASPHRALPPSTRDGPHSAAARRGAASDSEDDSASDTDSDLSSLDGFGDYARGLGGPEPSLDAAGDEGGSSSAADSRVDLQDDALPSPRQLVANVQLCSPRPSEKDAARAAEDLQHFLQTGDLPLGQYRLARLLAHADTLGPDAFAGLSLHCLAFERCAAALQRVVSPLPLASRSGALAQLQAKLSGQLLSHLGSSLERVLESERACQRFCRLQFVVVRWLLEHGPADRGETLFDLANLWLEQSPKQHRHAATPEQQAALAALIWRRPLAANFLACMEANLHWAAQHVSPCPLRPARLPDSLDGRFSFTAEFELHDLLELKHGALASGRPQQQHSPAMYCGGYAWWAVLVANPQHSRFELYASCAPFSLFLEPYRAALQPAADVRFSFLGNNSLVDWRQSNEERTAACHTHWGGPAFWVPPTCPSLVAGGSGAGSPGPDGMARASPSSGGVGRFGGKAPLMSAAARPDTARGPNRPASSLQASRLSMSSTTSLPSSAADTAAGAASGSGVGTPRGPPEAGAGSPAGTCAEGPAAAPLSSRSSLGGGSSCGAPPKPLAAHAQLSRAGSLAGGAGSSPGGNGYEAESGAITARHLAPEVAGLCQLSMDQLVAEVRRSCPYSWGASLRVRLTIRLLGR